MKIQRTVNKLIDGKQLIFVVLCLVSLAVVSVSSANEIDTKLEMAFENGELNGLHSVLVMKEGEIVAESYFSDSNENGNRQRGEREHGPDTLHDLNSLTQSIVGLLYGIALKEGKVPSIDSVVLDEFPEYSDLPNKSERRGILIKHILSMQMGIKWNEDLPFYNPENSETAMKNADDRYRYVLEQPLVHKPGDVWVYNSGALALVGKIIVNRLGMPIDQFAKEKLFAPLGITDFEWEPDVDGVPSAISGLRLSARSLAKIGQLIIDNGMHKGDPIVDENWLNASFEPNSTLASGLRYGFFWWLAPQGEPPTWIAGIGNGGQLLNVQPKHNLVMVIFAGNFDKTDAWKLPILVIEDFVVPELQKSR